MKIWQNENLENKKLEKKKFGKMEGLNNGNS